MIEKEVGLEIIKEHYVRKIYRARLFLSWYWSRIFEGSSQPPLTWPPPLENKDRVNDVNKDGKEEIREKQGSGEKGGIWADRRLFQRETNKVWNTASGADLLGVACVFTAEVGRRWRSFYLRENYEIWVLAKSSEGILYSGKILCWILRNYCRTTVAPSCHGGRWGEERVVGRLFKAGLVWHLHMFD